MTDLGLTIHGKNRVKERNFPQIKIVTLQIITIHKQGCRKLHQRVSIKYIY